MLKTLTVGELRELLSRKTLADDYLVVVNSADDRYSVPVLEAVVAVRKLESASHVCLSLEIG